MRTARCRRASRFPFGVLARSTKYYLSFRNDGGFPDDGGNANKTVTASLSFTYVLPSSSSFAPPDGSFMLPDGSGFAVPVELTPLPPDVATVLVEEGIRLSPGVGPFDAR